MFEGHQGPITGIHCHAAVGAVDFSHLFVTSSFDWTVKLWTTKVSEIQLSVYSATFLTQGGALILQGRLGSQLLNVLELYLSTESMGRSYTVCKCAHVRVPANRVTSQKTEDQSSCHFRLFKHSSVRSELSWGEVPGYLLYSLIELHPAPHKSHSFALWRATSLNSGLQWLPELMGNRENTETSCSESCTVRLHSKLESLESIVKPCVCFLFQYN